MLRRYGINAVEDRGMLHFFTDNNTTPTKFFLFFFVVGCVVAILDNVRAMDNYTDIGGV
jgi:hypothetical protein